MASKAEEIASHFLRIVLKPLSAGAPIEDSEDFGNFQTALTRVIPSALAEAYDHWQYEGLDGFRFAVARKLGPDEAEFVGLCLLVRNQTWIPLHVRMRIAPENDRIVSLQCKVGELGNSNAPMVGTPYGATPKPNCFTRWQIDLNRFRGLTRSHERRLRMPPNKGLQPTASLATAVIDSMVSLALAAAEAQAVRPLG